MLFYFFCANWFCFDFVYVFINKMSWKQAKHTLPSMYQTQCLWPVNILRLKQTIVGDSDGAILVNSCPIHGIDINLVFLLLLSNSSDGQ